MISLSHNEQTQYMRHLHLSQFGLEKQLKLKEAHVVLIGAGGLGCPIGLYLAAAGVGNLTVIDGDQIEQSNFHDYPLARIAAFPSRFEAHVLNYDENPTGVGEMGIPSAAPALTNAIFAATGKRIRELPILDQLKE